MEEKQKSVVKLRIENKIIIGVSSLILMTLIITSIVIFTTPNEPKYQWYTNEMRLHTIWGRLTGEGITIAFLDSGLSSEYKNSFEDRIVNPYNFVLDNHNWYDSLGHGTSMIVVASGNYNDIGIWGVAPKSKIMPVIVTDDIGRTDGNILARGIVYAVENGANIINISLGSQLSHSLVEDAINYALDNGVFVVASVGDYSMNKVLYPAKYDGVIAVQAQSKLGGKYVSASWGNEVDFSIPGEQIMSYSLEFRKKQISNGSSISTSIMSGIIALLLEKKDDYELLTNYLNNYKSETTFLNVENLINNY